VLTRWTISARPRRSSAYPAVEAATTIAVRAVFVTCSTCVVPGDMLTCAGATESEIAAAASAAIIDRSP